MWDVRGMLLRQHVTHAHGMRTSDAFVARVSSIVQGHLEAVSVSVLTRFELTKEIIPCYKSGQSILSALLNPKIYRPAQNKRTELWDFISQIRFIVSIWKFVRQFQFHSVHNLVQMESLFPFFKVTKTKWQVKKSDSEYKYRFFIQSRSYGKKTPSLAWYLRLPRQNSEFIISRWRFYTGE
jgi:hypothetical protein